MILDLPLELTEQVLLRLPVSDLVPLTSLSSSFYELIHNSHLIWTHHLREYGLLGLSSDEDGNTNTLEKFRARFLNVRELDAHLSHLSHDHLHKPVVEIDLEQDVIRSRITNPDTHEITFRHLNSLVHSPNEFTNLTARFYAQSLLITHIQAGILRDLERCIAENDLFQGSLMVSRWVGACLFEPSVVHSTTPTECIPVRETIRDIVEQCRVLIPSSASIEDVIGVINRVLYLDFGLQKNVDNYYDFENNRIDKVLYQKKGIPITICILYHEIASQLGLRLPLINFPRHFLLSFQDSSNVTMYIDCFNKGNLLTRAQCLQLCPVSGIADKDKYFQPTSAVNVLARLVRNAVTFGQIVPSVQDRQFFALNLFKLMSYLAPNDHDSAGMAINLSLDLQIKCNFLRRFASINVLDTWEKYCRTIAEAEEMSKQHLKVKLSKPDHILYSIGSVMLHKRFNYTCVIYGWDEKCEMSAAWQQQMGISRLEHQGNQPYYKVLADDDSERYVAQENLLWTRGVFIPHRHVGKYFSLFDGERFVPNSALKTVYKYLDTG